MLTADRLDRLADAKLIARRSRRIAMQSAVVGMGLSLIAMGFAAGGLLPPAAGALLQEGIDLAVILNALRALRTDHDGTVSLNPDTEAMVRRFAGEHDRMRDDLSMLRDAAQQISAGTGQVRCAPCRRLTTSSVTPCCPTRMPRTPRSTRPWQARWEASRRPPP